MAKVIVNLPNTPKGKDVFVPGIGKFPNGGEYESDRAKEDVVVGVPFGELSDAEQQAKERHEFLYSEAQRLDIRGRTQMSDNELEAAINAAETANDGEGE